MQKSFWQEQNAWWKSLSAHAEVQSSDWFWSEADRRLRCLIWKLKAFACVSPEDREDVLQTVLLQLQVPEIFVRLTQVEAPVHYLAAMLRNELLDRHKDAKAAQRAVRSYAELSRTKAEERPDQISAWKEECGKARFIVNYILSAQDRKVLWWHYKDGLTASQIGARLGVSEAAALQRLFRARRRVRKEFEKPAG